MDPIFTIVCVLLVAVSCLAAWSLFNAGRALAQLDRLKLAHLERMLTLTSTKPGPERFPPGSIPVEMASLVRDAWKGLGLDVSSERALRLVSVAHRIMCQFQPTEEPIHYNDADRQVPSMVRCQALNPKTCSHPDCTCPAVEPEPPVSNPKPSPSATKG